MEKKIKFFILVCMLMNSAYLLFVSFSNSKADLNSIINKVLYLNKNPCSRVVNRIGFGYEFVKKFGLKYEPFS